MESSPPLVSVILPCFNAEATLERALTSVAEQDYPSIEVIAVDDGSSDRTPEILAARTGPVMQAIRLPQNRGAAAARNAGLAAARGDYVAFLDADDEWLPAKLSRQMAVIGARPNMTFVSCTARVLDAEGRIVEPPFADLLPEEPATAWKALLADTFVWTPTVLARRSCLEQVKGFDESLVIAEDQDLWIRLALLGEVGFIDETLAIVHERPGSLSAADARLLIDNTLAMVLRHVKAQRHRLSAQEVRQILGRRYTRIGRNVYARLPFRGGALIARAILRGYRPFENLLYLLRASPMLRWLKRDRDGGSLA
jgi:glycosyltransferase involved in cell wall biosynthesis